MTDLLWNYEDPITELTRGEVTPPRWIDQDINPSTVAASLQGGCNSGAYMPAVTYHDALETMQHHGNTILDYLEDSLGELPTPPHTISWSGLACHYLSRAVELWAASIEDDLRRMLTVEEGE